MNTSQERFVGNDKHLKVLLQASETVNPALWNEFAASMGPRFRADLRGADLEGCRLQGVRLTGARLENACLDRADLSGADLTHAELAGASFRDAVLTGAKFKLPSRVKIVSNKEALVSEDPDVRRRRRMDVMERSAQALLEERQRQAQAKAELNQLIKAKNRPSLFANSESFTNSDD